MTVVRSREPKARLNSLARRLFPEGKFEEFRRIAEAFSTKYPADANVRMSHAAALLYVGRLDDARTEINTALDLDPRNPIVLTEAGSLLFDLKDYDAAQDCVSLVAGLVELSEFVHGAEVLHLAGRLAAERGESERARTMLQAAVDVGAQDIAHARYAKTLALYLAACGDVEAGRDVARKALTRHPDDHELKLMTEMELHVKPRGTPSE